MKRSARSVAMARFRHLVPGRAAPIAGVASLGLALVVAVPAVATIPSPPPGAPAVESAPSSLTGLTPQLPAGVIAASSAPGSKWKPDKAIYGSASINDIALAGAGGTTIRVNEIYPTLASGQPAPGKFPVLLTMTPYGKGQGGSSSPGSASSASGGAVTGGADNYLVQRGLHRGRRGRPGHRRLGGSWGLFDPIQQQDAITVLQLGRPPAALRRAGRHLRAVLPGDRPAAAGGRDRPELAAEGDLPDGLGQRHLPRHLLHGRPARLRVRRAPTSG